MSYSNQLGLAGSPLSGGSSPSSPSGEKINRTQAKKKFRDEIDQLTAAVQLLPLYSEKVCGLKSKEKYPMSYVETTPTGAQFSREIQIGVSEYKEFIKLIVARMKSLTPLAFNLNRTRRRTGPNAGFSTPAQFSQEIVNFFANAVIGPIVDGNFIMVKDKSGNQKAKPNPKTLEARQNTRLNDVLYFTQQTINGRQNPLYGIISPGTLTPLFAIHAYYATNPVAGPDGRPRQGLQNSEDATRLSASAEMRQVLGGIMQRSIQKDVLTLTEFYAGNPAIQGQVRAAGEQLLQAIQDPNIHVNSRFPSGKRNADGQPTYKEIFNPNYFLYAHFSKLISNGKAGGALTPERLDQLRPQIPGVYGNNVLGIPPNAFQALSIQSQSTGQAPAYENVVLSAQQNFVAFGRAYKSTLQGVVNKRKKTTEAANKKAQQQLQIAQQAQAQTNLQGLSGLSGLNVQGLSV